MSFLLYLGSLPNGFIQFGGFIQHWYADDYQISIYSQSCGPIATCNFWNLIYINCIEIKISSSVVTAKFLMLRSETWKWLSYETAKIWKHSNDCYVSNYYCTSALTTETDYSRSSFSLSYLFRSHLDSFGCSQRKAYTDLWFSYSPVMATGKCS